MLPKINVIILANTLSENHFKMTQRCINSFLADSGNSLIRKIIVVESNHNHSFGSYANDTVIVLQLKPKFNYNQYLNIVLKFIKDSSLSEELVCISNNDVEVKSGCLSNIVHQFNVDKNLKSASPVDRTWHNNSYSIFPADNAVYYGYTVTQHLLGFCIFARTSIFDIIGSFDERFYFYHQDNDYSMCLKTNNLKHALLTGSHIQHGHDKPESGVSMRETYAELAKSEVIFNKKWHDNQYQFFRYNTLVIYSEKQTSKLLPGVILVTSMKDQLSTINTQYAIVADEDITERVQGQLLDILQYKPDQVVFDRNLVTRRF